MVQSCQRKQPPADAPPQVETPAVMSTEPSRPSTPDTVPSDATPEEVSVYLRERFFFDKSGMIVGTCWERGSYASDRYYPIIFSEEGKIILQGYPNQPCPVEDSTPDEVWGKLKTQIFTYGGDICVVKQSDNPDEEDFLTNQVHGVLGDVCVTDLDRDGEYELLYAVHTEADISELYCYIPKYAALCSYISVQRINLLKTNDYDVCIESSNGITAALSLTKQELCYTLSVSEPPAPSLITYDDALAICNTWLANVSISIYPEWQSFGKTCSQRY